MTRISHVAYATNPRSVLQGNACARGLFDALRLQRTTVPHCSKARLQQDTSRNTNILTKLHLKNMCILCPPTTKHPKKLSCYCVHLCLPRNSSPKLKPEAPGKPNCCFKRLHSFLSSKYPLPRPRTVVLQRLVVCYQPPAPWPCLHVVPKFHNPRCSSSNANETCNACLEYHSCRRMMSPICQN